MELLEAIEGYWKIIPSPKKQKKPRCLRDVDFLGDRGLLTCFIFYQRESGPAVDQPPNGGAHFARNVSTHLGHPANIYSQQGAC